ncbi:conjugal transfer protein TraI [Pseudochryseolinea flava]|uniref:Conjugal transfer protein TraI n=1 Tax=Pseudochryseolinea flava TaxID=2059302 RepID=A0A364XTP6_9BACT|nr:conjugal transfer protein TraI [Pseudochryseolinea flava]RAV97645.1 conjugal transfer protein TraI [Pseudochryseolinea flava]
MRAPKIFFALGLAVVLVTQPCAEADAAIPIAKIIKEAVKKVIKAVDLMIQRLQNKTIWQQNAQKVLENKLNELKLTEIAEWTEKHRKLYADYYEELWKVKNTIAMYQRVRQVMDKQVRIVDEYKRCWNIVQNDKHFTDGEREYMAKIYSGIMDESVKNLDQILIVINSFKTQMTDAKRLEIIEQAASEIDQNYFDLKQFNTQNMLLSISRAKDEHEIDVVKKLYGLPDE